MTSPNSRGNAVGNATPSKIMAGSSLVQKVMVGELQVWPASTPPISNVPTTTVTWAGSTVYTGTTNTNFPTHTAGDLLLVASFGGVPPSGYTLLHESTASPKLTLAYKWATGAGTGSGTWTGASAGTLYVFRNANTSTPFGAVASAGGSGTVVTTPVLTLTNPSGDALVAHTFYNNATSGAWVNTVPANFLGKNQQARMANNQMIDTAVATAPATVMTHTASATFRSAAFEVLPLPRPVGLYDVVIEYLPAYEVRITAVTTYADDPNEAFFFRSTPVAKDGYTARTFTKQYSGTTIQNCTLEDYWANPTGVRNTITFSVYPKP